jgi:hypothetical protein
MSRATSQVVVGSGADGFAGGEADAVLVRVAPTQMAATIAAKTTSMPSRRRPRAALSTSSNMKNLPSYRLNVRQRLQMVGRGASRGSGSSA